MPTRHTMHKVAVLSRLGVSHATLCRYVRHRKFPLPVRPKQNTAWWDPAEVEAWIKATGHVPRPDSPMSLINRYREAARESYAVDGIEIDPQAKVVTDTNGRWVAAWVFVHEEDI